VTGGALEIQDYHGVELETVQAVAKREPQLETSVGVVDPMTMEGVPALTTGAPGISFLLSNKDMLT
jgi:hypothetical protein